MHFNRMRYDAIFVAIGIVIESNKVNVLALVSVYNIYDSTQLPTYRTHN